MAAIALSNEGRLDGVENMARDRLLLAAAERGALSARVYRWNGPWVSLGMFQIPERDLLDPERVPWVMRPTGGKAVLHGHDETIGLAAPIDILGAESRSIKAIYRAIIRPIVRSLDTCGLPAVLAADRRSEDQTRAFRTADCFAHTSPNDVVDPATGVKVCGCALRVTDRAVLVQASIPNGCPLVDPQTVFAHAATPYLRSWDGERLSEALEAEIRLAFG